MPQAFKEDRIIQLAWSMSTKRLGALQRLEMQVDSAGCQQTWYGFQQYLVTLRTRAAATRMHR
jgi:hypothetical protein